MRKLFLAAVVIAAAVGGAGYYFFRTHPEASPSELLDAATGYLTRSLAYAKHVTQRISAPPQPGAPAAATPKAVNAPAPAAPSYQPKNLVTLYLTNGGSVWEEAGSPFESDRVFPGVQSENPSSAAVSLDEAG